ncbi:universal stress protein in QAH/OAS sulfhydrylase 3'region isoform X1 [Octopus sinensis]|uniref:Universal stress protein in QAH/OAS sulfhydrylase 3'region isoform X1 n=1 Tax=Octopus sinensis TaxID=2607531 RepID=A0A6P7SH78_9MOLL|nr:universal stress protein in QAH/OAS sulfhydrylase 3'region isoform X1 [Octopus sinensis]
MAQERTIVIAVDGSSDSEYAFNWTIENILKENDYLICAHCPEPMPLTTGDPVTISNQFKVIEDGVQHLIAKFAEILKKKSIKGKVLRLTGKPKEAIIAASKEEKANMIVTGTRGLGIVGRTILGSVSDYVAHNAQIPVVIVRKE